MLFLPPALVQPEPSQALQGREATPVQAERVQAWIGPKLKPDPFLAFARARSGDLTAAAREPHRTFLARLLSDGPEELRGWAATRLVEADAPLQAFEPAPFPRFLELAAEGYALQLVPGYREDRRPPQPPLASLGEAGVLDRDAPVMSSIRDQLRGADKAVLNWGLFAVLAPNLMAADRDWVFRQWTLFVPHMRERPAYESAVFQMAANWLLSYGVEKDWESFLAPAEKSWKAALARMRKELQSLPQACRAPLDVLRDPAAFQAAFGFSRESAQVLEWDPARVAYQPPGPSYPEEAKTRRISGAVAATLLVGAQGEVLWLRPEPGYPLAFLGPAALTWAAGFRFRPSPQGARPGATLVRLMVPFRLRADPNVITLTFP